MRRARAALLLVLVEAALCRGATGNELDAYLAEVAKAQRAVSTLRARFVQEKRLSIVRETLRSSGTFLLGEEGRIAWIVEEPDRLRVVMRPDGVFADGDPVRTGPEALSPLPVLQRIRGFLTGLGEGALRDLDVTRAGADALRLTPRSPELSRWVGAIVLTLDPERKLVHGIRLEEPEGDVTEIHFSDVEVNPPLGEDAFAP